MKIRNNSLSDIERLGVKGQATRGMGLAARAPTSGLGISIARISSNIWITCSLWESRKGAFLK